MPIRVVCPSCQKEYNLKDEYAGKRIKCPACEEVMQVPEASADQFSVPRDDYYPSDLDPVFHHDKFLLRQKHFALLSAKYEVWNEDGEAIMWVNRPYLIAQNLSAGCLGMLVFTVLMIVGIVAGVALFDQNNAVLGGLVIFFTIVISLISAIAVFLAILPKRHITFYADSDLSEPILTILQDKKIFIINATYTCQDPDGNTLGRFHKNYLYNIFRKRWYLYNPEGDLLAVAMEDSMILSMLRRLLGPLWGILRTNFVILKPDMETHLGDFNRKFTLFDRYVLDMTDDGEQYLDRRLAIALGVLLDTGEHR